MIKDENGIEKGKIRIFNIIQYAVYAMRKCDLKGTQHQPLLIKSHVQYRLTLCKSLKIRLHPTSYTTCVCVCGTQLIDKNTGVFRALFV